MGVVFLAEQLALGRLVALKVLHRKFLDDSEFLLRFHNEAASTGRIHHPNVVTIYEYGQSDEGSPYIAMEYLEGHTLRQLLKSRGPLPLSEAVDIVRQVARGLNAAHKLGIIHRDLKPDNIFVTEDDEGQRLVKVTDFGIAKLRESASRTLTGVVMGTPPYMSFEQASGMRSDELDARSDVYSLGIVTYEVLTGRAPFHADTPLGYIRKHLTEDPPTIYSVKPDLLVPQGVEAVILKALRKEREQRCPTALLFARELSEAALGDTMAPRPRIPRVQPGAAAAVSPALTAGEEGTAATAVETPPTPEKLRLETPPQVPAAARPTPRPERVPPGVLPQQAQPVPSFRPPNVLLVVLLLGAAGLLVGLNWHSVRQLLSPRTAQPERSSAPEPLPPPPGMVEIQGGEFLMGRDDAKDPEETPAHSVSLPPFYLDRTPVTNGQYAAFVRATDRPGPPGWTRAGFPGHGEWPVTNVSWHEARAYCEWKGRRLPTEAEWEFTARGPDGRLYPWGNEFDSRLPNTAESGLGHPRPVGVRAPAASPFGVLDMSGNVWEWCEEDYAPYPGHQSAFPIPAGAKVIRGGSFASDKDHVTTTTRNLELASTRSPRIGFRCAKSR